MIGHREDRGYSTAWRRPPAPRVEAACIPVRSDAKHGVLTGFVFGYIISTLASIGILIALFKNGW